MNDASRIQKTGRKVLPSRRLSETRRVVDQSGGRETRFFITIGYAADDPCRPMEVFYSNGFRSGSTLEWLVSDAAILVSLALQRGLSADEINRALVDAAPDHVERGSIIRAITSELAIPPEWVDHEDILKQVLAR